MATDFIFALVHTLGSQGQTPSFEQQIDALVKIVQTFEFLRDLPHESNA